MITIPCPWCGTRNESEFTYGGEAHISRPKKPEACSDQDWADYLYVRSNTKGVFAERWNHSSGCRQWFNVIRDTVSDKVLKAYKIGARRPNLATLTPSASPAVQSTDGLDALSANNSGRRSRRAKSVASPPRAKTGSAA